MPRPGLPWLQGRQAGGGWGQEGDAGVHNPFFSYPCWFPPSEAKDGSAEGWPAFAVGHKRVIIGPSLGE